MACGQARGPGNLNPTQGDARSLLYADATFDAAYLVVIHEVPDQDAGLLALRRVLRPDVGLVVGVSRRSSSPALCDSEPKPQDSPSSGCSVGPRSRTSPASRPHRCSRPTGVANGALHVDRQVACARRAAVELIAADRSLGHPCRTATPHQTRLPLHREPRRRPTRQARPLTLDREATISSSTR